MCLSMLSCMRERAYKNVLQNRQTLSAARESLGWREATIREWQDSPILDDSGSKNCAFKMHQICLECSRSGLKLKGTGSKQHHRLIRFCEKDHAQK